MHSYLLEFALCKRLGTLNTGASLRISGSSQQMRALSAVLYTARHCSHRNEEERGFDEIKAADSHRRIQPRSCLWPLLARASNAELCVPG